MTLQCPMCRAEMHVSETLRQIPQYRKVEMIGAKPITIQVANDSELIRWAYCSSCSYSIHDVDNWVNQAYNQLINY